MQAGGTIGQAQVQWVMQASTLALAHLYDRTQALVQSPQTFEKGVHALSKLMKVALRQEDFTKPIAVTDDMLNGECGKDVLRIMGWYCLFAPFFVLILTLEGQLKARYL